MSSRLSTPIEEIVKIFELSQNKKAPPRILPDEALYKNGRVGFMYYPQRLRARYVSPLLLQRGSLVYHRSQSQPVGPRSVFSVPYLL